MYPQTIKSRRRRRIRYQRHAPLINNQNRRPININQDILNRIVNIPQQSISNPLIDQFFNGTLF